MQRIDEEGRDAPDIRSGELRSTTRRLHLPSPFGYLGGCWGWWWVREHEAWNLAIERRVLGYCVLFERQLEDNELVRKEKGGNYEILAPT